MSRNLPFNRVPHPTPAYSSITWTIFWEQLDHANGDQFASPWARLNGTARLNIGASNSSKIFLSLRQWNPFKNLMSDFFFKWKQTRGSQIKPNPSGGALADEGDWRTLLLALCPLIFKCPRAALQPSWGSLPPFFPREPNEGLAPWVEERAPP